MFKRIIAILRSQVRVLQALLAMIAAVLVKPEFHKAPVENLPEIFARQLEIEHRLYAVRIIFPGYRHLRQKMTEINDTMARHGVTAKTVKPWSPLVGGDGNRSRYEQELRLHGMYFA